MTYRNYTEDIINTALHVKSYIQLYDAPWKTLMERQRQGKLKRLNSKLNIALICHPCYGFGDIIFALKIFRFMKEWYNIDCTMITTKPAPFIQNGLKSIFCLKTPGTKTYVECENLKSMKIYDIDKKGNPTKRANLKIKFDLIMVTPWIGTDFEPDKKIVKNFLPYANHFNTILFSEYNAPDPHKYDFPTGIGKNLNGLLITRFKFSKTISIKNPYLMVHLTEDQRVDVTKCFSNFIKLMCKKYHKLYDKLDVIIPKHILDDSKGLQRLFQYIKKRSYYQNIIIKTESSPKNVKTPNDTLTLRVDIGPLPYNKYTGLFKNCLPDVLITGDQSVTDIISCCKNYNIYYQIMPWKTNFAKNLSIALGKDFIGKVSSSCGLEKFSIRTKLNLKNVSKNHSFEKLGKPKLDAILTFALELRRNKYLQKFIDIVLTSRKKQTVFKKLKELLP
jgi:hypothetical protein